MGDVQQPLGPKELATLREAIGRYDSDLPYYDEIFEEVSGRIRQARSVGKLDIAGLVFWKRIRSEKVAGSLLQLPEDEIRRTTASALADDVPETERLRILGRLPGFGGTWAVGSSVLAAWKPEEFAVTDRRARRALTEVLEVSTEDVISYMSYIRTVRAIRNQVAESDRLAVTARDVDKALFVLGG